MTAADVRRALAGTARAVRHPGAAMRDLTGSGPVFPLLVLFGLNAVDELDRTAFGILLPEIRDDFGLDLQGVLTLVAFVSLCALLLQVPIAWLADRADRIRIAWIGAAAWGVFSLLTGLASGIIMLAIVRAGSAIGKAVVDPTHNSLIADYYPPEVRPRVYSFHRAANAVGAFVGPLTAGLLASWYGWRAPFFVFVVPTAIFVVLAWRLRPPVRGSHERRAMGADEATATTEESAPSFAEGWRLVWKIPTLRRIWYSLPFLASSLVGFVSLAGLLYEEVFDLDEKARGFVAASTEPIQLVGLIIGARIATKLMVRGPGEVLRFLGLVSALVAGSLVVFALAPNIGVAVAANMVITASLAVIGPGILSALSLAIPPRARSIGFSVSSLWIIPGIAVLPVIGAVGDRFGIRTGMVMMVPLFLVGGAVISSTRHTIAADIEQVWKAAAARSEAVLARAQGRSSLLVVKDLEVAYGNVQVLFGVDVAIDEGEVVALLGTNGAGKSTLLNAICGLTEADRGAVIFDGRDITHAPPEEIAGLGLAQVPGGRGVFPSLTVAENLALAADRRGRDGGATVADVEDLFPTLAARPHAIAGDLSGGQQQMLALGMTLLGTPRVLLIDELSLGLAPAVVAQLLPVVEAFRDRGTTVVLVEQSVNVALDMAERAIFLEKGVVRFDGTTKDLFARPDILRSVFLAGADGGDEATVPPDPAASSDQGRGADDAGAAHDTGAAHDGIGNGAHRDAPAPELAGLARRADDATAVPERPIEGAEVVLAVRGLSVRFGGVAAVRDVDLDLHQHEILGIIGPNGAGKTTLFDLLSGFVSADRGRIELGGRDITAATAPARARAGLGRSFQDARLFPSMTVRETIAVSLERWVTSRDPFSAALRLPHHFDAETEVRRRVDELIDLLGLHAFADKFIRELSTGSRRIVDLAGLLAHRPSVILLDEPSSGIAQREAEALVPLLRRIRTETGAALVVIEHDIPLLSAVADRFVAMDQGAVVTTGPPADVLVHPVVVESYLGPDRTTIERSGARPIP